jgi:SOS-response transcriptional repressor LexA
MQVFSDRLRTLRIRSGLTQQGLADLTGFSLSAIGNWETCQNVPSPRKLAVLATKLDVSIDQLLGHDSEEVTVARVNLAPPLSSVPQPKTEIRQVPVVSWAQAGGLVAWTNQAGAWHEFAVTSCSDQNSFGVTVAGDSMEPKYSAGDIAILRPNAGPRNGCLVICKLKNDGVFFKMFHKSGDNALIRLSSYNPVYPVMECKPDNLVWIYPVDQIIKNVWR